MTTAPATASDRISAHPLDPLCGEEIAAAIAILRTEAGVGDSARFVYVTLDEPSKREVADHVPGGSHERRAHVVVRDLAERATYEGVVSLTAGKVLRWETVPGAFTPHTQDDIDAVDACVKADPGFREALARRGIDDVDGVVVEPWPPASATAGEFPGQRISRPLTFVKRGEHDNEYARPVEGLITYFDLDAREVLRIEDHGAVPIPPASGNYSIEGQAAADNVPHNERPRPEPARLEIAQPDGPGFEVRGREVHWERWRFRVGFTPREGLVLHTIGYEDGGRVRPIVYRASLSELFVPYGDPAATHAEKAVFDAGENGLGVNVNSLELGCDCLGEIHYFDADINDDRGGVRNVRNAICLHEEDDGVLWKHHDGRTGATEVRRSRRLVVSSFMTLGNYDYGIFWYLHQDGSIKCECKLTGIMSMGAIADGELPRFGTLCAPGLYAPNHQHIFTVRLDMSVDGERNTVYEVDSEPLEPGPENPLGNAWETRATPLRRESEAQRSLAPDRGRYWRVTNASSLNALGAPVAYRLAPGENVPSLLDRASPVLGRARYVERHLWVTRHDPEERYAAGAYPYRHPGGAGVSAYAAADREIEDADVVLWYTFGSHHVPRPEDWPITPVIRLGFYLKPDGFFDANPALDVPPSRPHRCHG